MMDIEQRYKYWLDGICKGQHEATAIMVLIELLQQYHDIPTPTPLPTPKAEPPKEQVVYDGPAVSDGNPFKLASDALKLRLQVHVQDASAQG